MIIIDKTKVMNFEGALRAMRNPMDSWELSDSYFYDDVMLYGDNELLKIGENDLKLALKLVQAGTDHAKFLRQIIVNADITAPLYWWKQFDQYKVGTVTNSTSTMHTIHKYKFVKEMFSIDEDDEYWDFVVNHLEELRQKYLETKDSKYWREIIQKLPESFNQLRTVTLNYAVLRNIYKSRANHKLNEWHEFCKWIETLPVSELITY